ncbi:hypothetical protein BCR44DRAFT_380437 [Catenaria anguillulae PL171]|uniref:Uncharacterized protein n=1 Tax=Catenaria anguillulae PL171 TaxID=765915 RepID=A0A1Y2HM33_9FUNG|nr:hypothetical protein BCR44DRAFT_380437 [Catenaria anguillulae PL171]
MVCICVHFDSPVPPSFLPRTLWSAESTNVYAQRNQRRRRSGGRARGFLQFVFCFSQVCFCRRRSCFTIKFVNEMVLFSPVHCSEA